MAETRYIIIHSWSIKEVEQRVNEAMRGGNLFPTGGIEFDGKEYFQALVMMQICSC